MSVTPALAEWITRIADRIHAHTDQEATRRGLCVQRVGLTGRTIHDPRLNPTKARDHQCPATPQPDQPQHPPRNEQPAPAPSSTPPPGTGATPAPPYVA